MHVDYQPQTPPPEGGRDSHETLKTAVEADLRQAGVSEKTIAALMTDPGDLAQLPAAFARIGSNPEAIARLQKLAMETKGN